MSAKTMEWLNGIRLKDVNDLTSIESEWKIKLPYTLRKIVSRSNKSYPGNYVFNTEKTMERVFGGLLDFDLSSENNIRHHYEAIRDRLPEKVFPIAIDPGGNYICLDYRIDKEAEPKIILWDHEGFIMNGKGTYNIEYVASSFDNFLSGLYKDECKDSETDFSGFEMLD
jgi:hypothetical protein